MPKRVSDPLLMFCQNALRQGNIAFLPVALRRMETKLEKSAKDRTPEAFALRLTAAELYRISNQEVKALQICEMIVENPPPGCLDLLARAQRLYVSLCLDLSRVEQAYHTSLEIDGMVIINSESRGGSPMISRNAADVSVETMLCEAEVAIYRGDFAAVSAFLTGAAQKLGQLESNLNPQKISSQDLRAAKVRHAELRYNIHFLAALLSITTGKTDGFDALRELSRQVSNDSAIDRRILTRIKAASGAYDLESDAPPFGISLKEAKRLFAVAVRNVVYAEVADTELMPSASGSLSPVGTGSQSVAGFQSGENSNLAAMQNLAASSLEIQSRVAEVLDKVSNILVQYPLQNAPRISDKRRPFAFGGGFEFFALPAQLAEAMEFDEDERKFTGFFQVQWSPEMVETSILAKNLDPAARAGEGFIFLVNGMIVDATIGSYDTPAHLNQEHPDWANDAHRALKIMVQIGMGMKLDHKSEGFGSAYPAMSVKERRARLQYNQASIVRIVAELDRELSHND